MVSGPEEFGIEPDANAVPTWTPFMYSRNDEPSYVPARCVQVLSGTAADPSNVVLQAPPNAGGPESEELSR